MVRLSLLADMGLQISPHYANYGHYPLRLSINGEQVTYATDTREDILRAADIFLENGIHTETGPHKHAI